MNVTPDGVRYLTMAEGQRVARPFHYRWLLPAVCGPWPSNWRNVTRVSIVLLAPAMFWYAGGGWPGVAAAAMPFGLSGVMFNWRRPVLVDAPALLLAVVAAALVDHNMWGAAVLVALVAGCCKESAPAFAACYCWNPVPLVGLIPVAVRHLQRAGDDVPQLDADHHWLAAHPFKAGWLSNQKVGANWPWWLLPWGACLVGLANLDVPAAVTLTVGFATVWMATDWHRLWVWAFPPLAVAAVTAVPESWLLLLVVGHMANPFKGEGV